MPQIRLHVREAEGDLPNICMRCGQEATCTKTKNLSWFPPWVSILILAGLLPYAIVATILTKKALLRAPFCDQHKGHWFNRSLLMWGTFFLFGLLGLGGFIFAANLPRPQNEEVFPFVCVGSLVFFVVWAIIVVVCQQTAIRPKEITDREILLEGVCDTFVQAIAEVDRERVARKRKRKEEGRGRWDDDEDEPRPTKRPPRDSSDHIQE